MGSTTENGYSFLGKEVHFSDSGNSYELSLSKPLTDYRKCHDGTPEESRILFLCKRRRRTQAVGTSDGSVSNDIPRENEEYGRDGDDEELVIKIKVQMPDGSGEELSHRGPSTTTAAELQALEKFRDSKNPFVPHLVDFQKTVQDSRGPLPGGYITFTVMTKMPGQTLFQANYWKMPESDREEIKTKFLHGLRSIYALGIEPEDRALRNIMWELETRKCFIIDFELWKPTQGVIADHVKEFQRWGVARRPPPRDWWAEWNMQGR